MNCRTARLASLLPFLAVFAACEYRESGGELPGKLAEKRPPFRGRGTPASASKTGPEDEIAQPITMPYLSVSGRRIVDESGRPVQLRGCNLGSWLLIEPWMIGIDSGQAGSEKEMWDALYRRMQSNDVQRLIKLYRDNFVTQVDFSFLKTLGVNAVRVPIWWRALMDPAYGGGWEQLDRVIKEAKKNGIYVILDLHGAPGGQTSKAEITGEPSNANLWHDDTAQQLTIDLWRQIALRYRDEPAVAGYDLLNEAFEVGFEELVALYERIYTAVREVDQRHIIYLEDGFHGLHKFPRPEEKGWTNVVFSFHYYPANPGESFRAPGSILPKFARVGIAYDIPLYVGEFNTIELSRGGADLLRRYCEVFDYYGWPWTMWSYKTAMRDWDVNWGIYGQVAGIGGTIDLTRSSPEEIANYFLSLRSERLVLNTTLAAAMAWRRSWPSVAGNSGTQSAFSATVKDMFLLPGTEKKLRIEWKWTPPNIGYWAPDDAVVVALDVPESGNYEIFAVVSHGGTGCVLAALLDGILLGTYSIAPTAGWGNYISVSLGVWRLERGRHYLRLQPATTSESFINLREIYGISRDGQAGVAEASTILLSPFTAEFPPGSPFRVEWEQDIPDIGFWRSRDPVSWCVENVPAGRYEVSVEYASPHPTTRLSLLAGESQRCELTLHGTGGWHRFRRAKAGEIVLPGGELTISVVWQTASPEGAGNLRLIRMARIQQRQKDVEDASPQPILMNSDGPPSEELNSAGNR